MRSVEGQEGVRSTGRAGVVGCGVEYCVRMHYIELPRITRIGSSMVRYMVQCGTIVIIGLRQTYGEDENNASVVLRTGTSKTRLQSRILKALENSRHNYVR